MMTTSESVDVSIIIPFYKGDKYIPYWIGQLDRMFDIAYKNGINCEAIFVNDSPDEPLLFKPDQDVKVNIFVINNSVNLGIQRSRIEGFRKAKGIYVLFVDQDDYLEDNTIVSQMRAINSYDAVVSNGKNFHSDIECGELLYGFWQPPEMISDIRSMIEEDDTILSPGQVLIRKSSFPSEWENTILSSQGCDDYLLWIIMLAKGCTFGYNPDVLYRHNNHDSNESKNIDRMSQSLSEVLAISLNKCYISKESYYKRIDYENKRRINFSYKYQEIAGIESIWLKLSSKGKKLSDYLLDNDIKNLIIYGWGMLGRVLYRELKTVEFITVLCVIDKNAQKYYGKISFKTIEEAEKNAFYDADLIIVTVLGESGNRVNKSLKDKKLNSIVLQELLYSVVEC